LIRIFRGSPAALLVLDVLIASRNSQNCCAVLLLFEVLTNLSELAEPFRFFSSSMS